MRAPFRQFNDGEAQSQVLSSFRPMTWRLYCATTDHYDRKTYEKINEHGQSKYWRLWRRILKFTNVEGKRPICFDGHEEPYNELVRELAPPANAISERTDATVLLRTEGFWDTPSEY